MTTNKEKKLRGFSKITTKMTLIFTFSNILVKFYSRVLMSSLLCLYILALRNPGYSLCLFLYRYFCPSLHITDRASKGTFEDLHDCPP
jgi:hypothetical protein